MAKPMTAMERVKAFTRWGVKIHAPDPNWDTRDRPGEWGPVHGVMIHHTGDDAKERASYEFLRDGYDALRGPLCHWGMGDDGRAWMVGNGRASHAGRGSGRVLNRVISEDYGRYPPHPGEDDTDGNPHFYGQETMYSGRRTMTVEAYTATIRVCAAICEFHGWNGKSVIGHKEWTARKPDPGKIDMRDLRADVNHALAMGPTRARKFVFRNE